ncbi:hypothetical protein JX266_011299 [Neoarthrinium moseri]|nr:hypothetical protein JX266_011299 [Neoarthrinium moseri]
MSTSTARLHLVMPPGLERFHRFGDLPYDIRHKIWEMAIFTPGIHFLKFERTHLPDTGLSDDSDSDSDSDADLESDDGEPQPQDPRRPGDSKTIAVPSRKFSASLRPIFPLPAADMSYYITATQTLTQLTLACNESRHEVEVVVRKPNNLLLDSGRLISLDSSSDIICIDYPDLVNARGLSRWADTLDLDQLATIRRLAVRYHPDWDQTRRLCHLCGRYHGGVRKELPRRHLYQFAALFRNLKAFYFVDHLIVRKPFLDEREHADPRWLGPHDRRKVMDIVAPRGAHSGKGERFQSGGRTYYEIDRELCQVCKVHSHVFNRLQWVQENFITHCEKSLELHPNPRMVRFGVLACEWEQEKLVQDQTQPAALPRKTHKLHRGRHAPGDPNLVNAMAALALDGQGQELIRQAGIPVVFGDQGASKYDFTFSVEM